MNLQDDQLAIFAWIGKQCEEQIRLLHVNPRVVLKHHKGISNSNTNPFIPRSYFPKTGVQEGYLIYNVLSATFMGVGLNAALKGKYYKTISRELFEVI